MQLINCKHPLLAHVLSILQLSYYAKLVIHVGVCLCVHVYVCVGIHCAHAWCVCVCVCVYVCERERECVCVCVHVCVCLCVVCVHCMHILLQTVLIVFSHRPAQVIFPHTYTLLSKWKLSNQEIQLICLCAHCYAT